MLSERLNRPEATKFVARAVEGQWPAMNFCHRQDVCQRLKHQGHRPDAEAFWLSCADLDALGHDHRFIKRPVKPMLGFKGVASAAPAITDIEIVGMIRKGQFRPELRPFHHFCQLAA